MIKNELRFFYRIMFLIIAVFLLLLVLNTSGSQLNVFFLKTGDLGADFFNILRYISEGDPYYNEINGVGEKCYFPLSYIILYPFSCMNNYADMSLGDCWHSNISILSCVIFTLISSFIFIHSIYTLMNGKLKINILLVLLLSYTFLFSIERGNLIIITAGAINYYLAFYKSEKTSLRYWALIALCIATTLKVYPIILGLFLLKEKRYRDIAFCVILTSILVFLPFLFFKHGFDNILQLWNNVQVNSDSYSLERIYPRYSLPSLIYGLLNILGATPAAISLFVLLSRVLIIIGAVLSVLLALKEKDHWRSLALLSVVLLFLPVNSALYCGLYFFPVIIIFLQKEKMTKHDRIYLLLFCVFLNPLQIVIKEFSINYILSNLALLAFWGIVFVSSWNNVLKKEGVIDGK